MVQSGARTHAARTRMPSSGVARFPPDVAQEATLELPHDGPRIAHAVPPHANPVLARTRRRAVQDGRHTLVFYARAAAEASTQEDLAGTTTARRCLKDSLARAARVHAVGASARARDCGLMALRTLADCAGHDVTCTEYCALLALFSKHHNVQTRVFKYRHLVTMHAEDITADEKMAVEFSLLARFEWRLLHFLGPGCLALLMLASVYGHALHAAARRAHDRHAHALFQHAALIMSTVQLPALGATEITFHILRRRLRSTKRWQCNAARVARNFGVEPSVLPLLAECAPDP